MQASPTLPKAFRGRNPDVLTCIANLSNDEVFTPPEFANRMLDTLAEGWAAGNNGANIWADSTVRFLDPCTKSGVFLREITSRLIKGLAAEMPDLQTRVGHILTKQVFGIGITQLTSLLARRSLYCSKHAMGEHSVAKGFASDDGNIWFERTEHTWVGAKCKFCGAPKLEFDRSPELENHAYAFIHTNNASARMGELFGGDMQFDVIIGNPPYQLDDGGFGQSAAPIYQLFIEQALSLEPRYASFVTPSRWMTGGKGLDKFREKMLSDRSLRKVVDYPKLYEAFPGVKIRGGISYFLWDKDNHGPCSIQTIWDGKPTGPAVERFLDAYDVLVRRNEAIPILEKVRQHDEATLQERVSTGKPFGFRTFFHGKAKPTGLKDPIKLFGSQLRTSSPQTRSPPAHLRLRDCRCGAPGPAQGGPDHARREAARGRAAQDRRHQELHHRTGRSRRARRWQHLHRPRGARRAGQKGLCQRRSWNGCAAPWPMCAPC
jgi:hypothetical protein